MQKTFLNVVYGDSTYAGFNFEALPLGAALIVAQQQVEQAADQARFAVVGDPLRVVELQMAEEEAKAYRLAGFDGTVPPTVQALVDAKGLEPRAAAESILDESTTWRAALCSIRAARLKGREAVLTATSHDQAEVFADTAIAAIRASTEGASAT